MRRHVAGDQLAGPYGLARGMELTDRDTVGSLRRRPAERLNETC